MTEESEIHEDVVLALIEAFPESCTMRCIKKEKQVVAKKGRRNNFKLDGFHARKITEHKRGSCRPASPPPRKSPKMARDRSTSTCKS